MNIPSSKPKRKLKQHPPLAVEPVAVTDNTSYAVLGLTPRRYREMVVRHQIPHVREGHRVLVLIEDWRRAMVSLSSIEAPPDSGVALPMDDDDVPTSADAVLAVLGRRRRVTR